MEWLNGPVANGLTAAGLLVILYLALVRGWIYLAPHVREMENRWRARVEEVRADRDQRLSEQREYHKYIVERLERENSSLWATVTENDRVLRVLTDQQNLLIDSLERAAGVVESIPVPQDGESGGSSG